MNLPPRIVKLQQAEFSLDERTFYTNLEAESRAQFQVSICSTLLCYIALCLHRCLLMRFHSWNISRPHFFGVTKARVVD